MTKDTPRGDAYIAVKYVYDKSPGRSWRRLNGALQGTLSAAIAAHLSFLPDDFAAIRWDMQGGYWMGNGYGSTCGERYYDLACKVGNTPACISFERYANRPAALWPEKVKTPERLHIGSDLTWKGLAVTVTNMRQDHLIACTYKPGSEYHSDLRVGDIDRIGAEYRPVEQFAALETGAIVVRYGAAVKSYSTDRKPDRVLKIHYADLATARKEAEALRRTALHGIDSAESPKALLEVEKGLSAAPRGTYRHFDIEDFRKAVQAKRDTFKKAEVAKAAAMEESERMERWLAGENIPSYFRTVRLRVTGQYVETSTGHSVSLASVRRALPVVLNHRRKDGARNLADGALQVDIHPVRRVSGDGVQIGCTLIPWSEVDRLKGLL